MTNAQLKCLIHEAARSGQPQLWQGTRRRTTPANWVQPLKWDAAARAAGKRVRAAGERYCHRVPTRNTTRITDREVLLLRELRWTGRLPYSALSKMFGRSAGSVWAARNGRTKAKLPMPWEMNR